VKEITIISGKGGTGKTSLAACFATLSETCVLADCDVDAPDLHLLFSGTEREREPVLGPMLASIKRDRCTRCGRCVAACRFHAILGSAEAGFCVDALLCRGCDACRLVCPAEAIKLEPNSSGEVVVSESAVGPLVQARLRPGTAGFGKLVVAVRDRAAQLCLQENRELVIIDGPAGAGCSAIASLSGVDLALIVAEPTLSGLHGAQRVLALARHFGVAVLLLVNKYDLNLEMTRRLELWAAEERIPAIGRIPFDRGFGLAIARGRPFSRSGEGSAEAQAAVDAIWARVCASLRSIESGGVASARLNA